MTPSPALPGPVSEWAIDVSGPNFRAKIEVASSEPDPGYWHSHQYTALIERLIEPADMEAWDGRPAPPRFSPRPCLSSCPWSSRGGRGV